MNDKRKYFKFKDKVRFVDEVKKFGIYKEFCKQSNIHINTLTRYMNEDIAVIKLNAMSMCKTLKIPFEEMFDEVNVKQDYYNQYQTVKFDRDKTDLIVSEEIICGIKLNIENRLSASHSKEFIKDISKLIDDIVIESSYLGVNSCKNGSEQFIVNAITKRRTEKL